MLVEIFFGLALGVGVVAVYAIPMALEERLTPRIMATLLAWAGAMGALAVLRVWLPGHMGGILMALGAALIGRSLDYVEASTREPEPEVPNRYRAAEPLAVTRPSLRSWGLFAIALLVLGLYYYVLPLVAAP